MGRILDQDLYPPPATVSPDDYLIGTKRDNNLATQTFPVSSLINATNVANGNSAMYFKFSDGSDDDITPETPGYFFSNSGETNPDDVNRLTFNDLNLGLQNSYALFEYLIASGLFVLKLTNAGNPNNVIYFNCNAGNSQRFADYFEFEVELFNDLWQGEFINETTYVVDFELNTNIKTELTAIGTTTVDDNDVTLSVGFEWLINNFENANAAIFVTNRPFTASGNKRTDIIVGNNIGGFDVISGIEGVVATQPNTPPNKVLVSVINITDTEITTTPGSTTERPCKFIKPAAYSTIFTDEAKSLIAEGTGVLALTISADTHPENSEIQVTHLVDGSINLIVDGTYEGSLVFPRYATAHFKLIGENHWAINYRFKDAGASQIQADLFAGIAGTSQIFSIPAGKIAKSITVNRTNLYQSEFTQVGVNVTVTWEFFGDEKVEITYQ